MTELELLQKTIELLEAIRYGVLWIQVSVTIIAAGVLVIYIKK